MSTNIPDNFFRVNPIFFPHLPLYSRVLIAENGKNSEWFVKKHKGGAIIMENQKGGATGDYEYNQIILPYNGDTLLWKQYDEGCMIELRLIYNSLAEKDERIRELEIQVNQIMEKLNI